MPSVTALGLLLAGGLSRRMGGGDKALRPLGGRTLLDHVIDRVAPQVGGGVLGLPALGAPPTTVESLARYLGSLSSYPT